MTTLPTISRAKRTIGLFLALVALGSTYLISLGYFLKQSENYADGEMTAAATRFAASTRLVLPAELTFEEKSEWSKALATGWNRRVGSIVWSSRRVATIVLPAIVESRTSAVCISVAVGSMSVNRHWPMLVTVNGHVLAPRHEFMGAGPFTIQGVVTVPEGTLIHVRLAGPETRIPNLISSRTGDSRSLGFRLFGISMTARCGQP